MSTEAPPDFLPPDDEATHRRETAESAPAHTISETGSRKSRRSGEKKSERQHTSEPLSTRLRTAWTHFVDLTVRRPFGKTTPVGRALRCVSPLGWTVLAAGAASWIIAAAVGWKEFAYIAAFLLILFVLCACFLIGRVRLDVSFDLSPRRVTVGNPSMANFEIRNTSTRPMLSIALEIPVGQMVARYVSPSLAPNETYSDWVTVTTTRRGVVTVGPMKTQRGDPLGLLRREVEWSEPTQLFVHPKVALLDELGTGLLRDLEGQTTQDVSASDLAFHALREYIPGDDQRYIHWKSTARLSSVSGEPKFLVRQFLDTRRSHVVIVSDVDPESFADEDEFELALSCAASVAVRTVTDEMDLTLMCGHYRVSRPAPYQALDTYARAQWEPVSLNENFVRVSTFAPDASLVVAVIGSKVPFAELQRGRAFIDYSARLVVIRVDLGANIGLRETTGFTELTVGSLDSLPRALQGGIAS